MNITLLFLASVLDLAYFSVPGAFSSVSWLSPIDLNDHAVVKFLIKWQTPSNNSIVENDPQLNYSVISRMQHFTISAEDVH